MLKVRSLQLSLLMMPVVTTTPCWCLESVIKELPPCISVSGEGKVFARPNMAEINVGVIAESKNAVDALKTNSESMSALMKTLAGKGIADKDVLTASFNVSPQYRYDSQPRSGSNRPTITGYSVNNQVHVRVRNLATLGDILDAVVENGANTVNGISFSISEPEPILDQARQKAVADARRKAELYALASGTKLGRVLYITESGGIQPPRPMMMGVRASLASSGPVPIATGEQENTVSVTITYSIE
jgi:uncharacterized protein YggE